MIAASGGGQQAREVRERHHFALGMRRGLDEDRLELAAQGLCAALVLGSDFWLNFLRPLYGNTAGTRRSVYAN